MMGRVLEATLNDGSRIPVHVTGAGPSLLLPVNPVPVQGEAAEEMRAWGADPALGHSLVAGLEDRCTVVAFDYEGHLSAVPQPDTLTPQHLAEDFVSVADTAGAGRFAYYGYSWLALAGLQLALRTDRLGGLALGGFPPRGGPYQGMLRVTRAAHEMASNPPPAPTTPAEPGDWSNVTITLTEEQTRQYMTLYTQLQSFDERAALAQVRCPRLCFAGTEDEIDYGPRWGDVQISMGDALAGHQAELEAAGWTVRLLEGLDHTQAMQAALVLPLLRAWLDEVSGALQ
jgi:pimeloyl-ACP methyl ester carboxylesterase